MKQQITHTGSSIEELRARLSSLESDEAAARQAVEQAEAAWKAALADLQLGEGQKTGVSRTRSALDRAQENLLGLDGAIAEIRRRISAAEDAEREGKVADLIQDADRLTLALHAQVDELLTLDGKAAKILERALKLMDDLSAIKGEYQDLDPDGLGPGRVNLASRLWDGLATDSSAHGRTAILVAQARFGEFETRWNSRQAQRVLGQPQPEHKER